MSGMKVSVTGVDGIIRNLHATSARLVATLNAQIAMCSARIVTNAKANAPYRTGRLRNSIAARISRLEAEIVATAPYAGFVEHGTWKMRAHPFLLPALEMERAYLLANLATVFAL